MGSHSVTRHPTQVNTPRLNPNQTGRYLIYLPRRDERLSWPRWLVTYRDGLPAHRRSPIQVPTRQCTTGSLTHNLLITSSNHYITNPQGGLCPEGKCPTPGGTPTYYTIPIHCFPLSIRSPRTTNCRGPVPTHSRSLSPPGARQMCRRPLPSSTCYLSLIFAHHATPRHASVSKRFAPRRIFVRRQ